MRYYLGRTGAASSSAAGGVQAGEGRVTPNQLRDALRGIIAFTPTPFTAGDQLATDVLAAHVDRLARLGGPWPSAARSASSRRST